MHDDKGAQPFSPPKPDWSWETSFPPSGASQPIPDGKQTLHSQSDRNAIDHVKIIGAMGITHRRTAYHHPEGNSYIERFHRSLKEEEVGLAEYRNLEEARESSGRYLGEYNHDGPYRGLRNRTPREAYVSFESDLEAQALSIQM